MRINIVNKTNRDFFIKSSHQNKINFNSFCVASEPFNSKNLDDFINSELKHVDIEINGVRAKGDYIEKNEDDLIKHYLLLQIPVQMGTLYLIESRFEKIIGRRHDIIYVSDTKEKPIFIDNELTLSDKLINAIILDEYYIK